MIRLKKGQHAMWHPHKLTAEEIEYIITKMNAVEFINKQEEFYKKCFTKDDEIKYRFLKEELSILQNLKL